MSLIHWWPLNGDTKDYGINSLDLIPQGSIGFTTSGKIGQGASFTSDSNNLKATDLATLTQLTNYSMCCWIYLSNRATNHSSSFLSSGNWNTGAAQVCFGLYNYSSGYNRLLVPNKTGWSNSITLNTKIQLNVWHHFAITYDGTITKGYIDGQLVGTYSGGGISATEVSYYYLGAATYYYGFTMKGVMNDFRIYDHTLSIKEIKEISKGLILHYDFEDPYIEATTNLATANLSNTCYNGAKGTYGYGTSTDMYKDDGFYEGKQCTRVYMGTNGASAYPYVYFDQFDSAGTNIRTLSFDYFPTTQTTLIPYSYNGQYNWSYTTDTSSGSANNISQIVIRDLRLNTWNHITITAQKYDTSSTSRGCGYIRIGTGAHTSSTANYWLFANVQVEAKDHATGYTPLSTSRAASPVYDCSGYNNNGIPTDIQIIPNTSYDYACDGRYAALFDGNTSVVQTPSLANLIHDGIYSISLSFYVSEFGSKTYGTLYGGPSGFEIESKRGGTNSPLLVAYSWGQNSTGGQIYDLNKWNHLTMIRTTSETKWYLNGVLWYTGTAGAIPAGDYFIGAWKTAIQQNFKGRISDFKIYATALSESDVLTEYQRKAAIDKNGNVFTGRFIETTIQSTPKVNKNDTFSASSLSEGLITQVLSDGSIWERIYYFDYDIAGAVWTKATAQSNNTPGRFSILGSLNSYVPKSGWYEFYYKEKNSTSTNDIRWKQSFNPLSRVTSGTSGTASEYTFISGINPHSQFAGITRYTSSDENSCYLRGAPSWWCAIAPYQTSYDVFPDMWGNSVNNHHQELWIRIDNMIATPTYSNTQAKLNSTSIMCASAHEI